MSLTEIVTKTKDEKLSLKNNLLLLGVIGIFIADYLICKCTQEIKHAYYHAKGIEHTLEGDENHGGQYYEPKLPRTGTRRPIGNIDYSNRRKLEDKLKK